jgi:acetylglutamate kinase
LHLTAHLTLLVVVVHGGRPQASSTGARSRAAQSAAMILQV